MTKLTSSVIKWEKLSSLHRHSLPLLCNERTHFEIWNVLLFINFEIIGDDTQNVIIYLLSIHHFYYENQRIITRTWQGR